MRSGSPEPDNAPATQDSIDSLAAVPSSASIGESPQSAPPMLVRAVAPNEADASPGISRGGISRSFIFALGRVEARFPSLAVEKEFAQSTGRAQTAGLTDRQVLHQVLSERQNRYLVRHVCWVLTIEALETYILLPRDPSDFDRLVEAVRANPRPADIDLVVGVRGPMAPPEACNGLIVPLVVFDQIYSFDMDALVASIPKPERMTDEAFRPAAEELFSRIMQLADNAGATDEHRALNYLAVRYPPIYATAVDRFAENCSLSGVDVRRSRLSGVRRIVDVIFSYSNRATDVTEKYFVRVDVTEEFPFLVTKLSPYYER
jgi:PatG C-terminal